MPRAESETARRSRQIKSV